jgi:hypothetical protein
MSVLTRFAPLCFSLCFSLGAAGLTAVAPIAAADPALPEPGSEDASQTIADLQSRGYDIQINWVNGYPRVALSQCWVNTINMADAPTVWLDIECPK